MFVPWVATAAIFTNSEDDAPVVAYVTPDLAPVAPPTATATMAVPAVVAIVPVDPVGFVSTTPLTLIVSAAVARTPCVTLGEIVVAVFRPGVVDEAERAMLVTTPAADSIALDGAVEITPKPNEATATSAMRLRSVFVDICFLSISRDLEFPELGFG
jgi:hypothetical protein